MIIKRNWLYYSYFKEGIYHYVLRLTHVFNAHYNRKSGIAKNNKWIIKIQKSELVFFNDFINTSYKYKSSITNYFKDKKIMI